MQTAPADAIRRQVTDAVDGVFATLDVEILPYRAPTPNSPDEPDPDRWSVFLPLIIRTAAVESGRGAANWREADARHAGHRSVRTVAFVATAVLDGKDVRAGDRLTVPDGTTYRIAGPAGRGTTRTILHLEAV
ncbi:MAG TPA: hypothetical protein PLJ34_08335 [Hyphomicrobiales bacterium]|nr:hypothetical protein [Kaistiaceae bacterium]HQF31441.1 hypothetical protein [Hyphomicrobiales bacterium]